MFKQTLECTVVFASARLQLQTRVPEGQTVYLSLLANRPVNNGFAHIWKASPGSSERKTAVPGHCFKWKVKEKNTVFLCMTTATNEVGGGAAVSACALSSAGHER